MERSCEVLVTDEGGVINDLKHRELWHREGDDCSSNNLRESILLDFKSQVFPKDCCDEFNLGFQNFIASRIWRIEQIWLNNRVVHVARKCQGIDRHMCLNLKPKINLSTFKTSEKSRSISRILCKRVLGEFCFAQLRSEWRWSWRSFRELTVFSFYPIKQ